MCGIEKSRSSGWHPLLLYANLEIYWVINIFYTDFLKLWPRCFINNGCECCENVRRSKWWTGQVNWPVCVSGFWVSTLFFNSRDPTVLSWKSQQFFVFCRLHAFNHSPLNSLSIYKEGANDKGPLTRSPRKNRTWWERTESKERERETTHVGGLRSEQRMGVHTYFFFLFF